MARAGKPRQSDEQEQILQYVLRKLDVPPVLAKPLKDEDYPMADGKQRKALPGCPSIEGRCVWGILRPAS
jgi:hypothetical protein